jgi:transglutaminase-like putative cysteine protease
MRQRQTMLLGAEAALIALTVAVTISLERLFTDLDFLNDLLILVVGSHIVAAVCRRAELSMAWSTPISGVALAVLGTAVFYPDASALIIPTRETVVVLGDDLREAWQVFSDDSAPVPPIRGFLVTTAVLVWYGVFLADWAAFRLRSPLEAVAPGTAVFVFASLLGVDRNEIAHGFLFAAGLLLVLLTMRAERQVREEVWVAGGASAGVRTTLRVGAAAGVAALLFGALVAPRLPGASAQPIVNITDLSNGPETRSVLSPLVEISTSLVNQTNLELFSVRVDPSERDYWRLMALTKFENEIWRRSSNFDAVRDEVASDVNSSVSTRTVNQEITIASLGNIYLPAAYEVSNVVDDGGVNLEYEVATGALVVERGLEHIPRGLTYQIQSAVPDYSPADLPANATEGMSGDFVREHTELPTDCQPDESVAETGCWPTGVTTIAEDIVAAAGATTDHQRVLALQQFFLDPANFTYNIDVALEHNIDDMNTFLTIRQGYCEQFASTFAAMARSLGIPARVAVGFTWGDWDAARSEYVVRGKHAHAWPEVYFGGVGWVIFDPTPGRSRGHDSDVTQLPEPEQFPANAGSEDSEDITTTVPDTGPGPQAGSGNGTNTPTTLPEAVATGSGGSGLSIPWRAMSIIAVIVAFIGFVPFAQQVRRRRWIAAIVADPVGRGEFAWDDAIGALRLAGLPMQNFQTPHEFATMVAHSKYGFGPVRELADHVTWLRYSTGDEAVDHALAAQIAASKIVRQCREWVGRPAVIRQAFDPRMLNEPPPRPLFTR